MDLLFPHHECEIAQSQAASGTSLARYWLHHNLITINGQKMGKSLGNFITLQELFAGSHALLDQAYSPMTLRFFVLQAHYRSTLGFSNEALQAAHQGYRKLMHGLKVLEDAAQAQGAQYKGNPAGSLADAGCCGSLAASENTPSSCSLCWDSVFASPSSSPSSLSSASSSSSTSLFPLDRFFLFSGSSSCSSFSLTPTMSQTRPRYHT